jgi:hypothetical protein
MRRAALALFLTAALALPAFGQQGSMEWGGPTNQSSLALTAPTAAPGDNSNRVATTAFVAAGGGGGTPTGPAGGDLTGTYPNPTLLATVNANVGTFGSATSCITTTVNAKGLTTAISAATCTPAIGSITGLAAGIATWLATPSSANLRAALTDETGTGLAYFQGGDIGTPSAGVATNITALNATQLTTGAVPAARMPALTGDVTSTVGTVATTLAAGNAGNLNSGTLLAARMPALTGDCTSTVGTVNLTCAASTGAIDAPMGRLTLTTATPVLTATVTGSASFFFTPYIGNVVPIYNGTTFTATAFAEVSQANTDTTKSPAAVATSSVYDIFCWVDSGPTNRCTRGPVWTNTTTRSAGTALVRQNGILLNSVSITNGPAASRGTYVGTIASNGSSTLDYIFGASASGGTAAFFGVWNAYNRVNTGTDVTDSGASYGYTSATIRQARASAGNQVSFVQGLQEDTVWASYATRINTLAVASSAGNVGLGLNSTSTFSGQYSQIFAPTAATIAGATVATKQLTPALGLNVVSGNEQGDGSNANNFDTAGTATLSVLVRN